MFLLYVPFNSYGHVGAVPSFDWTSSIHLEAMTCTRGMLCLLYL